MAAPATAAELDCPNDVTVDPDGNLYIADTLNHRIRRLDVSTGIVTTVAGNGTSGFSGDNGPASEAGLNDPVSVAVDVKGHLYIADIGNERVRKVDSDGIITTVAGGGDPPEDSGDGGPATAAFVFPKSLALDDEGNLYISDASGIRKVSAASGLITTVAGHIFDEGFSGDNGSAVDALFQRPFGIALDSMGNLYIADSLNHRIRAVRGPIE